MLTRLLGFTQLELLISLSIVSILAALTVPSFQSVLQQNEIIAVAEALSADLRWARSEAFKRAKNVKITFTPGSGGAWKYVITTDVIPPETLKTVDSAAITEFSRVSLIENFVDDDIIFDHVRGTTEGQNGTATLTSTQATYTLKVILGNLERVRICSDSGEVGGYQVC